MKQKISRIINSAHTIIGFNVYFDLGFLSNIGIKNENAAIVDVMEDFVIYTENGASNMAVTNGKDSLNVQNITDMIGEQTLLTIVYLIAELLCIATKK